MYNPFLFQMLVYLFYFLPYYIMGLYGLLYPGCDWMPDWALLHAGAAAQVSKCHCSVRYVVQFYNSHIYKYTLHEIRPLMNLNVCQKSH